MSWGCLYCKVWHSGVSLGVGFFIREFLQSMQQMRSGGFTLVEIMVVVVILGILAAVVVPNYMEKPDQARQVTARQDISSLVAAVNLYRLDNSSRFPSSLNDLVVGKHKYFDILPTDPWGNVYVYVFPGVHGRFDISSYGADGGAGGSGFDADIVSWAN